MIWNTSLHTEGSANLLRRSAFPYSFGTCDDRAEFCGLRVCLNFVPVNVCPIYNCLCGHSQDIAILAIIYVAI